MKARFPLLAAFATAFVPLTASAQAWVNNPNLEGIGIRTGNFELHPGIGAEFGYDSNYFRTSGEGPEEEVVDVFLLRVTPSITISTLGKVRRDSPTPSKVAFKSSAYVAYHEVIGADSENSDVSEQRGAAVGANARLDLFPEGKYGFDIMGAYVRTLDTDGSSDDLAGEGFNRDTLRGSTGLTWRPGGGLFDWRAGYDITYNFIEDDSYDYLTNLQHAITTRGRWRFLPRSALMFDAAYTFIRYVDDNSPQNDGDTVRASIGYRGLVSYHLALLGMVGWASSFYKATATTIAPKQYDSITANAEARWFIMQQPDLDQAKSATGLSSVALGYQRAFNNSYQGSFYQRDRGYLQFELFLLGAVTGGIEFGVSRVGYPEVEANAMANVVASPAITQARFDGRLFAEYRFTDTFATNTTFLYDKVNSSPGADVVGQDLEYDRWQWYIGARLFL